jgi:competence ComEA-like helix-hairpin-helix protein
MSKRTQNDGKRVWMAGAGALCLVWMALVTTRASATPASPGRFSAAGSTAQQQDPKTLENAFFKVCGDCHEPDRIREVRRTRGGWEEVIEKMIEKGAVGNEQDFNQVLQYLLTNYGMVNMNQAVADDIAMVTGVSKKDAEAIVAFRSQNGKFKNYDALILVPGIDVKPLEEHKASLMF